MKDPRWRKLLPKIAVPFVVGVFYFTAASHFSYTPDDTYIYLQYAKNLVLGNGITFNAADPPSYGFTSPLWLFIISLGGFLKIDPYIAAKAVDLACASLSLVVFYLVASELMRDTGVALCATVAFSVNAWLLRWAGSGMETSLAVVLVLATFLFCLRNEYFVACVSAALLAMVRPESVAVVPLILLDLFLNSRNRRYALNMSAALVLVYCMLVAPWLIYARATFGSFLPNTASGKAGLQIHLPNLLATAWDIIKTMGATEACSLVVLLAAGVALFVTRNRTPANPAPHDAHGGEGAEDEDGDFFILRQVALCLGWIIILPLLYLLMDVNVVSRYLLLVTPFVTLLAFSLAHRLANRQMGRHAYSLVFAITTCVMLQNQIFYHRYVVPGITAFEQGMESCLIPVATWLKENAAPGSRVLVGDVGALGYYSNLPVCDAAGLITPSMLKLIHEGNLPYEIIEKKLYRGLCDVDYVVDRGLVPEQMKNDKDLFPMVSRPFVGLTLDDPGVRYYTVYKVLKK